MAKQGLWANINRRKKLGISRPKSESTISPEAYANMKKGFPKKKVKKFAGGDEVQGPPQREGYSIEPQVRGSSSFDENIERKTKGASLYLSTPGGRVGVHYDKDTDRYPDNFKMDTKRKAVSYDIQKQLGKGTLTAGASLGTSKNQFREGKTKQGMLSYTIPLGKSKGGIIKGKPKVAQRGWK
jgi:hypothetical protein